MNPSGMLRSQEGLTLVEVLLVLVLITLLTGGSVVAVRGRTGGGALRAGVLEIEAALRFASLRAQARGKATRLVFGPDKDRFVVESLDERGRFTPVEGLAGRLRKLPPGVRVSRLEEDSLVFDPSREHAGGWIELRSTAGRSARLTIFPVTGDVQVERSQIDG